MNPGIPQEVDSPDCRRHGNKIMKRGNFSAGATHNGEMFALSLTLLCQKVPYTGFTEDKLWISGVFF